MNCQFNADPNPDPAFQSNVDPDREPIMRIHVDPDPYNKQRTEVYVIILFLMLTKLAKITFLQEQIRTRKNTLVPTVVMKCLFFRETAMPTSMLLH
jgi:hypothetical protein